MILSFKSLGKGSTSLMDPCEKRVTSQENVATKITFIYGIIISNINILLLRHHILLSGMEYHHCVKTLRPISTPGNVNCTGKRIIWSLLLEKKDDFNWNTLI